MYEELVELGKEFKIKHDSQLSDFKLMMDTIESGDTVLFERGEYFIPDKIQFTFGIDITFVGMSDDPADVKLHARFLILEHAHFYLENMTIVAQPQDSGITLKNDSDCIFGNCIFESEGEYPVIYSIGASLYLDKCVIRNRLTHDGCLYAENKSDITMDKSSAEVVVIAGDSDLDLLKSLIIINLIIKDSHCFGDEYTIMLNYDSDKFGIVAEDDSHFFLEKVICPEEDLKILVKNSSFIINELSFTNGNKVSVEKDTNSDVKIDRRDTYF